VKQRIRGVVASLLGSYAQIIANSTAGITAFLFYLRTDKQVENVSFVSLILLAILIVSILLMGYFHFDKLIVKINSIKILRRMRQYTDILNTYSRADHLIYLSLSLLRYTIYTAQYLIFLRLFNVYLQLDEGIMIVGVIFLTQTILPTFAFAELFVRGSVAATFLHTYAQNDFAAIGASTCMWILNLIIPAVLGYFFIMRYNFLNINKT
jgi:hypothetical protein